MSDPDLRPFAIRLPRLWKAFSVLWLAVSEDGGLLVVDLVDRGIAKRDE